MFCMALLLCFPLLRPGLTTLLDAGARCRSARPC
jgi:hypothetical protein